MEGFPRGTYFSSGISLVSENHKLRKICIKHVLQNKQMINLGRLSDQKKASEYHIQEISQDFHGIPLRCSVVYSTHLAEQKKETFARHLQKEQLHVDFAYASELSAEQVY